MKQKQIRSYKLKDLCRSHVPEHLLSSFDLAFHQERPVCDVHRLMQAKGGNGNRTNTFRFFVAAGEVFSGSMASYH